MFGIVVYIFSDGSGLKVFKKKTQKNESFLWSVTCKSLIENKMKLRKTNN